MVNPYTGILYNSEKINLHITANQFRTYKVIFRSYTCCMIPYIYTVRMKGKAMIGK